MFLVSWERPRLWLKRFGDLLLCQDRAHFIAKRGAFGRGYGRAQGSTISLVRVAFLGGAVVLRRGPPDGLVDGAARRAGSGGAAAGGGGVTDGSGAALTSVPETGGPAAGLGADRSGGGAGSEAGTSADRDQ